MKNIHKIIILILLVCITQTFADEDYITQLNDDFKDTFVDVDVAHPVGKWVLPFDTEDRHDIKTNDSTTR